MKNHITDYNYYINEEVSYDNNVVAYLKIQMLKDRKEYKGHIPTKYNNGSKWSDKSWFVDEIIQFLEKQITSSYTLLKYENKYSYEELDNILKNNFSDEYKEAEKIISERKF